MVRLHILLVEDDQGLRETLRDVMRVEGHDVSVAASLADARAQIAHANPSQRFELIVLDLGLPDGHGQQFLTEVRAQSLCPILVISAQHDDRQKIALLDGGADDYLVKPFSAGELLARIRVAMRHRGISMHAATTRYHGHGVDVDLNRRWVRRDGEPVHLTPTEFNLLARLVRNGGQVVTHRQLLADVWGPEHITDTHYLRLYMAQLRAKLEVDPPTPSCC